jgi:CRP/FNR family transcriptional regulator
VPATAARDRSAAIRQAGREKPRSVTPDELRALPSPFFRSLADADLVVLGGAMAQRDYPAGQIVLLEGAASSVLYVVQAGRVKLFKTSARGGREQVLGLVRPGEMFNEVAVFDEGPNPASAQAIEKSRLFMLRRRDLLRFVADRPGIALGVTRHFAFRLRKALDLVEDLAFRDVTSRLARILLDGEAGASVRAPWLTQELLAGMAGSRREVIGRALKTLKQDGVITLERGRIQVRDRGALAELAGHGDVTQVTDAARRSSQYSPA